jgi:hypothetical protein
VPLLLNNVFNPAFQAYEFIHAREAAVAETDAELQSSQTQVMEALHKTGISTEMEGVKSYVTHFIPFSL